MNRRNLLALFGGAVAAPSVGVKAAAEALGVSDAFSIGSGNSESVEACGPSTYDDYWDSPLRMSLDASRRAEHEVNSGQGYPHMKSWGRAFRMSAVQRDHYLIEMYQHKMSRDEKFRNAVLTALGVKR
jgi:hypothetical protein